jgi:hypothetical protein
VELLLNRKNSCGINPQLLWDQKRYRERYVRWIRRKRSGE